MLVAVDADDHRPGCVVVGVHALARHAGRSVEREAVVLVFAQPVDDAVAFMRRYRKMLDREQLAPGGELQQLGLDGVERRRIDAFFPFDPAHGGDRVLDGRVASVADVIGANVHGVPSRYAQA